MHRVQTEKIAKITASEHQKTRMTRSNLDCPGISYFVYFGFGRIGHRILPHVWLIKSGQPAGLQRQIRPGFALSSLEPNRRSLPRLNSNSYLLSTQMVTWFAHCNPVLGHDRLSRAPTPTTYRPAFFLFLSLSFYIASDRIGSCSKRVVENGADGPTAAGSGDRTSGLAVCCVVTSHGIERLQCVVLMEHHVPSLPHHHPSLSLSPCVGIVFTRHGGRNWLGNWFSAVQAHFYFQSMANVIKSLGHTGRVMGGTIERPFLVLSYHVVSLLFTLIIFPCYFFLFFLAKHFQGSSGSGIYIPLQHFIFLTGGTKKFGVRPRRITGGYVSLLEIPITYLSRQNSE